MTKLTPEQQVDILWKALADPDHWVALSNTGQLVMHSTDDITISNGPRKHEVLSGSRDSIIEQLLAVQVAARLDGEPEVQTSAPVDPYTLPGPWTPADRNRNNRR
jgi:hypothetical protein